MQKNVHAKMMARNIIATGTTMPAIILLDGLDDAEGLDDATAVVDAVALIEAEALGNAISLLATRLVDVTPPPPPDIVTLVPAVLDEVVPEFTRFEIAMLVKIVDLYPVVNNAETLSGNTAFSLPRIREQKAGIL